MQVEEVTMRDIYTLLRTIQENQVVIMEKLNANNNRDININTRVCSNKKTALDKKPVITLKPFCQFTLWIKEFVIDDDILSFFMKNSFSNTFLYAMQRYKRDCSIHILPIVVFENKIIFVFENNGWNKVTVELERKWIRYFHTKLFAAVCLWRDLHLFIIYNDNIINQSYNTMILNLTRISLLNCSLSSIDIRKEMVALFA
jgi:hypothetical protein